MSVLFLDKNKNNIKFHKSINTITLNKKKINFKIFIISIFDYILSFFQKPLRHYYLENYCKNFKPRIIIGDQFNTVLFTLKDKFPDIKIYMYFSYLMSPDLQKNYINNSQITGKIDYLFLPHRKLILFLKKKIQATYIYSGFLKNNEIKLNKFQKKKYDLMIISEYRNGIEKKKLKKINLAFKVLSNIVYKYRLKTCIAFVSKRPDKLRQVKYEDEKKFYDKFNFKYTISNLDSYSQSCQSKIILSMNSNLGYELLSRGQKVIFISNGQEIYLEKYPFVSKIKDMEKNIIKLLTMKISFYKKIFLKKDIIKFDQGNKILKKQIRKDLNKL